MEKRVILKNFNLKGQRGMCHIIPDSSINELSNYCENKKTIIITDENVSSYYRHHFEKFHIIEIGTGERIKNLNTVEKIYEKLLELEVDRNSLIVGIGGGIVCDITGFIASTYMRGISFAFVPTTLLAQVDAAIGGKNGVNFKGYKNIAGTFNQPEFILYDFSLLKTLQKKEILCGLSEVIKHAAIKDLSYFEYLEKNTDRILSLDLEVIKKIIYKSIKIKTDIVKADELEKGERKKLNFGHTAGHGIEKIKGLSHGEAVSIGMVLANNYAVSKGILSRKNSQRIKNLIKKLHLPVEININKELLLKAIKKDKKRNSEYIDFVVLEKIGKAEILPTKIENLKYLW